MDIAALRIQRGQLKAASTRMKHFLISLQADKTKTSQLAARFDNYKSILDQFNEIQNSIECLDAVEIETDKRTTFEDMYYEIVSQCSTLLDAKKRETCSIAQSTSGQIGLRLPKIELPFFDGEYTDWLNFRDIFLAMIHENEGLNDVQKLHYLKSCLKNTAAQIVATLPTTTSNYSVAWQLINKRFNNLRILVKTHVENILDAASVQKESATSIRGLSDALARDVTALNALKQPTDSWSTLLVHIVVRKLDFKTRRAWEQQNTTVDDPSFGELQVFHRERAQFLENLQTKTAEEKPKTKRFAKSFIARSEQCGHCSKEHKIQDCEEFLSKSPSARFSVIKELRLCINCFQGNHGVKKCRSARCRKCAKWHHTLLHLPPKTEAPAVAEAGKSSSETASIKALSCQINAPTVLLSTARVQILQSHQRRTTARALLDSGSQANFITEELCSRLNLPTKQHDVTIVGLGNSHCELQNAITLQLKSLHNKFSFHVTAHVIITGNIPSRSFCPKELRFPAHVQLADPSFCEAAGIDILLGASIFYRLLCSGQIGLGRKMPTLQKTVLRWVVSGEMPSTAKNTALACNLSISLEEQMSKFWEIEEIPAQMILSREEEFCEEHFTQNVRRKEDGRFVVSLPLTSNPASVGESRSQAIKRLYAMERKFAKNPALKIEYGKFMQEYRDLGHMSLVEEDDVTDRYYPPPSRRGERREHHYKAPGRF